MDKVPARNCVNCKTELVGPVCHSCGLPHRSERWSTPGLIQQFIAQLTNIESGFLYTGKTLFTKPASLIHNYWKGNTVRYYNPFRYVLIWTAINLLINFSLGIDDLLQESLQPLMVEEQFSEEHIQQADQKFDTWLNGLVILMIPIFAFLTSWLFAKSKKNYAEHLILNAYMVGQQSLITSFTHFIYYLIPILFKIFMPFTFVIGLVYNTYVFSKVFQQKWWVALFKAFILGLIGVMVFFGLITIASAIALGMI